ncbi:hypothetical protein GIB67_001106 [Kingdonia uniflora]|uniref:Uncharacterized protein n=1 Tax=Kingdonia uniflora TaxID=39325 RepID=A0A7J7MG33_9MAGN|nr:hypothetical protein GIB67_001106 [Kingdonia uniflora]
MRGTMFPRLHINDTEQGGPRAPPRNKMALYEQLSVPSHNNGGILVPPALSNKGCKRGRESTTMFTHLYSPPIPSTENEKAHSRSSDAICLNTKVSSKRKSMNERHGLLTTTEDLSPTVECSSSLPHDYSTSKICRGKKLGGGDDIKVLPFTASNPSLNSVMQLRNTRDKHLKRTNTTHLTSRQHTRNQSEENLNEFVASKDSGQKPGKIACSNSISTESTGFAEDSIGYCEDKAYGSTELGNLEANDAVSETSMVDSLPGFDISPGDVVGVIGQKKFWKARKAIANQQRVFAEQVFELHRLIKVQRYLARSPHLLLENNSCVKEPAMKVPPKKFPKSPAPIAKQKSGSQKPIQSRDQNEPDASSTKVSPWIFKPPPGNQWLIPVMSPTEGLVYKPYRGSFPPTEGFMEPSYGAPVLNQVYAPPNTHVAPFHLSPYYVSVMNSATSLERVRPQLVGDSMSNQRNNTIPRHPQKLQPFKDSALEDFATSNALVRLIALGMDGSDHPIQTQSSRQESSVIKAVPHNPKSATESAARIFQSIQEERQKR